MSSDNADVHQYLQKYRSYDKDRLQSKNLSAKKKTIREATATSVALGHLVVHPAPLHLPVHGNGITRNLKKRQATGILLREKNIKEHDLTTSHVKDAVKDGMIDGIFGRRVIEKTAPKITGGAINTARRWV